MTLFVRGPRRKRASKAVAGMMPTRDTWPASVEPGGEAAGSRPATFDEYQLMHSLLSQRDLID
ncbi:hypothetical protein [Streptomyces celluloflavus]|uniref:hypothetical protein n=1 Tax=Streptomyces celluloflavus TaxID=58344 RepID=UPI0036C82F29